MREILFRGKNRDGVWFEGNLLEYKVETPSKTEKHYKIQEFNYGYSDNELINQEYMSGFDEEVIPETVGQYTGLTDKNGKKIFEGDIIKESYIGVAVIAYESASFVYKKTEDLKAEWCGGTCIDDNENGVIGERVEVIGNIHDQDIGE